METVTKFSYLDDRLNATGGFKTAITTRTKIWLNKVQLMWCVVNEILKTKKFSLNMEGKNCKSCERAANELCCIIDSVLVSRLETDSFVFFFSSRLIYAANKSTA